MHAWSMDLVIHNFTPIVVIQWIINARKSLQNKTKVCNQQCQGRRQKNFQKKDRKIELLSLFREGGGGKK